MWARIWLVDGIVCGGEQTVDKDESVTFTFVYKSIIHLSSIDG